MLVEYYIGDFAVSRQHLVQEAGGGAEAGEARELSAAAQ